MQMEPVRILLSSRNRSYGIVATADVEAAAKILAGYFCVDLESVRGWLIRSAPVYGFDCVLLYDRVYPVKTVQNGSLRFQIVDLTETVVLSTMGGEEQCCVK